MYQAKQFMKNHKKIYSNKTGGLRVLLPFAEVHMLRQGNNRHDRDIRN